MKAIVKMKTETGEEVSVDVIVGEDGAITAAQPEGVSPMGGNLACALGIHAWKNGVCVVCGKVG